jgi:hypothetical protein
VRAWRLRASVEERLYNRGPTRGMGEHQRRPDPTNDTQKAKEDGRTKGTTNNEDDST